MDFKDLSAQILAFRDERDWRQFHTPEHLAAAKARMSGQGFAGSPEARKAVEALAMRCAETHFRLKGYLVIDRSQTAPFDLECVRGEERILVEVKGTTTRNDLPDQERGAVGPRPGGEDCPVHPARYRTIGRGRPSKGDRRALQDS